MAFGCEDAGDRLLGEEFLQYVKDDMAIAVKDGGIVEVEDKNNV